jgi:hypothetical protein
MNPTNGGEVETFAETSFNQAALPTTVVGDASGTATTTTIFFTLLTPMTVHLDYDALASIFLNQALSPPPVGGVFEEGSINFGATLIGTGGAAAGTLFTYSPQELNYNSSPTSPNPPVTNSSPGTSGGYSFSGHLVSPDVNLLAGTYTFQLTQGSAARLTNTPEPASIVTWGLLVLSLSGSGYVVSGRRRS